MAARKNANRKGSIRILPQSVPCERTPVAGPAAADWPYRELISPRSIVSVTSANVSSSLGFEFGDQQRDVLVLRTQPPERFGVALRQHRREPLERLVQNEQPCAEHQRPAQRHHLALPARDRSRRTPGELLEFRQHRIGPLQSPPRLVRIELRDAAGKQDVFFHREGREQPAILGRIAETERRPAVRRRRARDLRHPDAPCRLAFVKPMMVRTVVVLPAPLRPISAALTPGCSEKLTLRSTGASAIATLTFSKLSIGVISRSPAHAPSGRPAPPPACRLSGSCRRSTRRRGWRSAPPCPCRARRRPR